MNVYEEIRERTEVAELSSAAERGWTHSETLIKDVRYLLDENVRLRNELEDASNKSLELSLLEMWHSQGIKEIYKYKHRIKVYKREGLIRYELFTDLTCGLLFKDVEDTANYRDATPEDYKVRVDVLLSERRGDNQ